MTTVTSGEISLQLYGIDPDVFSIMTGETLPGLEEVPVGGTLADLYGLPTVRAFSLYGVDPHCDCNPMEFCRNPLHPGPCKGWKRTLGAVAPGALRALEAERVRKANIRREAAIKRYVDAGKKVPARLKKPITLDPKGPGAPATPPSNKVVGIPTANELRKKVDDRRAAQAKAAAKAAVPSGSKKPRDGDGDGKLNEKYIPKGTQPASAPAQQPAAAPNLPTSGQPSLAAQKRALDAVNRVGKGRPTAKAQVEAYSTLSKDDFDALPAAAQATIVDDLKKAEAKFLDPKKRAEVQGLLARFGTPSPKPATPAPPTPAAAPSPTPNAPSAEAVRFAEALKKYTKIDNGKTLNDAAMAQAAKQLDGMSDADRKAYADVFAGKVAGTMTDRTKRINGIDIGPQGKQALTDEISAEIAGGGKGTPITDAMEAAWADTSKTPDLHRALFGAGVQKPPHGLERQIDAITSATTPRGIADAIDDAAYDARTPEQKAALEEVLRKVADDPAHPAWLRGFAESKTDAFRSQPKARDWQIGQAVRGATSERAGITEASQVYELDDDKLAKLPPNLRLAIEARRGETTDRLVGSPATRENMLAAINTGHPVVTGDDVGVDRIKAMPQARRDKVLDGLREQVDADIQSDKFGEASAWESMIDGAQGITYSPDVAKAIRESQIGGNALDQLDAYDKLSTADVNALPDAHAISIDARLKQIAENSSIPALRRRAALKRADLDGNMPNYSNPRTQEAALHAGVLGISATPQEKLAAWKGLRKADFEELNAGGRTAVSQEMQRLVDDPTSGLSLLERGQLQLKHDEFTGRDYDTDDLVASMASVGVGNLPDRDRFTAYEKLNMQGFDALPPLFQKSIRDDLERMKATDPVSYDRVMTRIDPAHVPLAPVTPPRNPAQEAALDVVYGVDPKSRTIPKQLSAYGGLKASDFHTFNAQEQNIVLGDLSYIVTTSKDANSKARAQKLIDRFAPPGTPPGSPAIGTPIPPANAVPGQVRYPDPGGVQGMLKQSTNPGRRGDEWMSTASGNRVWGKYGAAGLMLRHVDPVTGEERFLMAQRGPGISNPGKWQLPGGAIESLETPVEGATRETLEELGFKPSDLDSGRVHGVHEYKVDGVIGAPNNKWQYSSFAATVPTMLKPDLSAPGARAETSDAKWMTRAEIEDLDRQGKMHAPLAGGAIHRNITSLFPPATPSLGVQRPGPVTRRPARLAQSLRGQNPPVHPSQAPGWTKPHKQSLGKNLIPDTNAEKALSQQIKGSVRTSYRGKAADERLAAISAIQGFNDTPTVMSKREMDKLVASGEYIETWRGVMPGGGKSAAQIQEEFRSGPAWYGTGIFGNGYYLATQKRVAEQYASGPGSVVRVLIPKSAVMDSYENINAGARKAWSSSGSYKYVGRQNMGGGTLHDDGRYAAAKGVDGIVIEHYSRSPGGGASHIARPGLPSYNWVNRGVLIVQEA